MCKKKTSQQCTKKNKKHTIQSSKRIIFFKAPAGIFILFYFFSRRDQKARRKKNPSNEFGRGKKNATPRRCGASAGDARVGHANSRTIRAVQSVVFDRGRFGVCLETCDLQSSIQLVNTQTPTSTQSLRVSTEFVRVVSTNDHRYAVRELNVRGPFDLSAWPTLLSHIQPGALESMRVDWSNQPFKFDNPALYTHLHTLRFDGMMVNGSPRMVLFASLPALPALTSLEMSPSFVTGNQDYIETVVRCPHLTRLHFSADSFVPFDQLVRLLSAPLMQQNLRFVCAPRISYYGDIINHQTRLLTATFASMQSLRKFHCCTNDPTIIHAMMDKTSTFASLDILVFKMSESRTELPLVEQIVAILRQHPTLCVHVDMQNMNSLWGEEVEHTLWQNHRPLTKKRFRVVGRNRHLVFWFTLVFLLVIFALFVILQTQHNQQQLARILGERVTTHRALKLMNVGLAALPSNAQNKKNLSYFFFQCFLYWFFFSCLYYKSMLTVAMPLNMAKLLSVTGCSVTV